LKWTVSSNSLGFGQERSGKISIKGDFG
jgi:hypothetical protein